MRYILKQKNGTVVGVEFGKDIYDVTEELIEDVKADLCDDEKYPQAQYDAFAPTYGKTHDYDMTGIIYPAYASKNILKTYYVDEEFE